MTIIRRFLPVSIILSLMSCGGPTGSSTTPTPTPVSKSAIHVTWATNRERAVNEAGGGYRVYYSTTSGFNVSSAAFVDVPYVSGASAPTTATIGDLSPGTYYIKVAAYSALKTSGSAINAVSSPSVQISITVP
jgi:hypothetical protein